MHRPFGRCRARGRTPAYGGKEIAVKIRSNSHYRYGETTPLPSRNACRTVTDKRLLGKRGARQSGCGSVREPARFGGEKPPCFCASREGRFCYGNTDYHLRTHLSGICVRNGIRISIILLQFRKGWDRKSGPKTSMKHLRNLVAATLCLLLLFSLFACGKTDTDTLWQSAAYTADTELGTGNKTVKLEVKAGDKTVIFTLHTDEENLGTALLNLGLIAGDAGDYGLYVKTVNGITADYDKDQSYWGFYIDGQMAMVGVDGETVNESALYRLEYTK